MIYADNGDETYYHFNAHGDVVVLTNASGNKTKPYSNNVFATSEIYIAMLKKPSTRQSVGGFSVF